MQQESWNYEKTYTYALKLISKQACSLGKLKEKLFKKTTSDIVEKVISQVKKHNLLDDMQLCINTANMWIQKKPISKIQLIQKLKSYGFSHHEINESLHKLETIFINIPNNNMEDPEYTLYYIGGITLNNLKDVYNNFYSLSLWNALALASIIQMRVLDNTIDYIKIKRRLQLRGYSIDEHTKSIIQAIIKDETQFFKN